MFFQGTLQEGIASALQQSKLIVSFVHDDGEESKLWEEKLAEEDMKALLQKHAVAIRMQAGSQEAGYLAAIYPIPKTPTIVIMKNNGQLAEYIAPCPIDQWTTRMRSALNHRTVVTEVSAEATPAPAAPVTTPAITNRAAAPRSNPVPQAAPEPARSQDKGKGKGKAPAEPAAEPDKASDEAKKASDLFRQRKQERQQERQRILQQIENDKAARKAKAEEEREARRAAAAEAEGEHDVASIAPQAASTSGSARKHEFCALQVRLFDGSQVRTRLSSGSTVRKDVREWVDASIAEVEGGRSRQGYIFRVVFPSRLIDDTEEDQTLEELGLTPSSTLILVPKGNAAAAYDDVPGVGGIFGRIYAAIAHFFAMIALFFSSVIASGPRAEGGEEDAEHPQQQQQQPERRPGRALGGPGSNVRRLQDDQRDYQLYNGNSLNFEPRKDDKDDDENPR